MNLCLRARCSCPSLKRMTPMILHHQSCALPLYDEKGVFYAGWKKSLKNIWLVKIN